DLPVTESPEDLARYVYTLAQGMSVQSIAGASRDELLRVVETAMRGWPVATPGTRHTEPVDAAG
ncbi:MAG: hypothetical protein ACAI35_15415, partial [Candidatus Methylacidiphilales bacterium]